METGNLIVYGIIGVAIISIAIYRANKALNKKFVNDMSDLSRDITLKDKESLQ